MLTQQQKIILFVCVENAARSQMAEGFFNKLAPPGYRAQSAGTKPAEKLNPIAIQAMKEIGIDISIQRSKIITDAMIRDSAKTVNMGCMDKAECPLLFLGNPINWTIEDPNGMSVEKVRQIRDEIERRVKELVENLN
jgi:arsenate reductase